mmetsp:Transcript_21265/g.48583  ORF Transcript_21265/g.48583 Transcript_21265/m.48583 type:complete len:297 (-) Transcript_21265:188-1078(-)
MPSSRPRRRDAAATGCLAAAAILALHGAGVGVNAFTGAQPQGAVDGSRAIPPARGAAAQPAAINAAVQGTASATSPWPALGCALLLCTCATMSRRTRPGSRAVHSGHKVVTCASSNAAALFSLPVQPVCSPGVAEKPTMSMQPVEPLICMEGSVAVVAPPVMASAWVPSTRVETCSIPAWPSAEEPSLVGPRLRGKPARLAGSARHGHARHSYSQYAHSRSSRAARRSTGARLLSAPAHAVAVQPSFDASRQRMKIQIGFRALQRTPSSTARESRTPSTSHVVVSMINESIGRDRE